MVHGVCGCEPFMLQMQREPLTWICLTPGYDRHFGIAEQFGFKLVAVPLTPEGPDMDVVEELVGDPTVKGMWCVPKYSNPSGVTYSDEAVRRVAALRPAAPDFRVYWDNAYCEHDLYPDRREVLLNVFEELERNQNPDLVYAFCSTSKIDPCRCRRLGHGRLQGQPRRPPLGIPPPHDRPRQAEPASPRPLPARHGGPARAHGAPGRRPSAAVRACRRASASRPGGAGGRHLDQAPRGLLCVVRRPARVGARHRGAVQGVRRDADRRGGDLALRGRPRGHQHPHSPELPEPSGSSTEPWTSSSPA